MNQNDRQFIAQKIRAQYIQKPSTELDALREMDMEVRRPANIFAYIFGSISAVIMGAGMSLVMTELPKMLGMTNAMPIGIVVGCIGLAAALLNYPMYKKILGRRKEKYGPEILALSEKIMNA